MGLCKVCHMDPNDDHERDGTYKCWCTGVHYIGEPDASGQAFCFDCESEFHYNVGREQGMYRDSKGVLRLECPKCLCRAEEE